MTIATILRIINIKSVQQLGQVWLAATEAGGSLQLQPGAPANFLLQDFSRSFIEFHLIPRCISQSCNFEFHSQVEILSGRLKYKLIGKVGLFFFDKVQLQNICKLDAQQSILFSAIVGL